MSSWNVMIIAAMQHLLRWLIILRPPSQRRPDKNTCGNYGFSRSLHKNTFNIKCQICLPFSVFRLPKNQLCLRVSRTVVFRVHLFSYFFEVFWGKKVFEILENRLISCLFGVRWVVGFPGTPLFIRAQTCKTRLFFPGAVYSLF